MYLFSLIGKNIQHSLSPQIHQQFAKQIDLKISYEIIECESNHFVTTVKDFIKKGGRGMNVTIPFKQQAFALCDSVSERATIAESVNTLIFHKTGEIEGDNTDGVGFIKDLANQHFSPQNKTILILGAGGAARGILHPLLQQNPKKIFLANRTVENANTLNQKFPDIQLIDFARLKNHEFDLVIDCTSFLSFNFNLTFSPHSLAYDLKYKERAMNFLQWAKQQNAAHCVDGYGMLVEQAAEAFCRWTGCQPETNLRFR
jgi:shikimate dehydrogenase